MTCHDGQRAEIRIGDETSVVSDYEIQKGPDGSVIADPVVERVDEGMVFRVRPVLSTDRKHVTLILDLVFRTVVQPAGDPTPEGLLRTTEIAETRFRRSVTLRPEASVLMDLGRRPGGPDDGRFLLLLRAVPVDLSRETRRAK
jgi:hypothetical protein